MPPNLKIKKKKKTNKNKVPQSYMNHTCNVTEDQSTQESKYQYL